MERAEISWSGAERSGAERGVDVAIENDGAGAEHGAEVRGAGESAAYSPLQPNISLTS